MLILGEDALGKPSSPHPRASVVAWRVVLFRIDLSRCVFESGVSNDMGA